MTSTAQYARSLMDSDLLRSPALAQAIDVLDLTPGSRGLDAGCGIGLHLPKLSQAVQPLGRVVGLDASPSLLSWFDNENSRSVTLVGGTIQQLPFCDHSFDWLWSVDTVYPGAVVSDPCSVLREFRRVVKPGGRAALLYWSAQKLLPGYPQLEARLDAAFTATVSYLSAVEPRHHFLRASGWLREAGFDEITTRTFVADIQGPFDDNGLSAMASCFQMFWGQLQPVISADDWATFERLCKPDSSDFIARDADYHAFLTYTLFAGRVPVF